MGTAAASTSVRSAVSPEEWQVRIDLAACYRLIALYGWDDLVFTHISARVPGPEEHFLINAYGPQLTGYPPVHRCRTGFLFHQHRPDAGLRFRCRRGPLAADAAAAPAGYARNMR